MPEAALVSVSCPRRDLISGHTFDTWRRSTTLNSSCTVDILQTWRLQNYEHAIKVETNWISITCNIQLLQSMWLFNKQGHSPHMHNAYMHEAAYAPVTVMASEIPHCVSKFCWLPSESPFLRGYSIFSGETWSVLDKWIKKPSNMQGVFCLTHLCWRRLVCSHVHVFINPISLLHFPQDCCPAQTAIPPPQRSIPDDIN